MHQGAGPPAPVRRPATVDGMDNPSAGPTRIVTKTYAIVLLHEERGDSRCRCPPCAAATRRGRPCRSAWTWPGRPSGCAWPPCGGMGSRCRKTSASSPWIWAMPWTPWCSEWPCPWGRKRRLSRLPVANGRQVMRALHSDYAGYWQTPAHVASPPLSLTPANTRGRREEGGERQHLDRSGRENGEIRLPCVRASCETAACRFRPGGRARRRNACERVPGSPEMSAPLGAVGLSAYPPSLAHCSSSSTLALRRAISLWAAKSIFCTAIQSTTTPVAALVPEPS